MDKDLEQLRSFYIWSRRFRICQFILIAYVLFFEAMRIIYRWREPIWIDVVGLLLAFAGLWLSIKAGKYVKRI